MGGGSPGKRPGAVGNQKVTHEETYAELFDPRCRAGNRAPKRPRPHQRLHQPSPMATEAMCAMGRAEAVMAWIENYRHQFTERPRPSVKIDAAQWRDALGLHDRFADWVVFFQDQLSRRLWTEVVREWGALLAPGLAGAATHGIIRAGHAVRGLANEDTPIRRRELADGLAYWAATYEELPEQHAAPRDGGLPSRAIAAVPLLPAGRGHFHPSLTRWFISTIFRPLPGHLAGRRKRPGFPFPIGFDRDLRARLSGQRQRHRQHNRLHSHGHRAGGAANYRAIPRHRGRENGAAFRVADLGGHLRGLWREASAA